MNFKSTFYFLILLISFGAFAQTSVNILGNPYGGNPYTDINSAITASNDGDVILISGIHTETLSFNKSITLRGADPTQDIIQAAPSPASDGTGNQVISIFANPANNATITIENLGIRHGNQGGINGGGIDIDKVTGLITLRNLIIENNFTNELGGGIAIAGSNADIIECTIRNNESVKAGGGLIVAPNNGSNQDNTINIRQSLIDNNQGANGGGLYINGNPGFGDNYRIFVDIENSTISNNLADSGSGAVGGGSIWSRASTWTTNDGGDGTSTNVYLKLIHSTLYNNSHAAANKNGIRATGSNDTDFSAYNSIIVNADMLSDRALNFLNIKTIDVVNCILGGLENLTPADTNILDDTSKNNLRGRTATFAGITTGLSDQGGNTQVLAIDENSNSNDYCTASVTGITLPTIDQTGYTRLNPTDAGAFEVRCNPPMGVANDNVAAEAASFSWANNISAVDGYEYATVLSGGDPDVPGDIVVSGTLAAGVTNVGVTGLTNDTNYDFYIRSDCGGGELSLWSPAVPFTTAFQGNLFLNSRFTDLNGDPSLDIENDGTPEWSGYGTGAELDNIIGENVGFLASTEGLLRQDFTVIPGVTYVISFNYRWVSNSSGSNDNPPRTPAIRNDVDNALIENLPAVQTGSDTWYTYTYAYTHPTSGLSTPTNRVRFQIFKDINKNQLNFYNITVLEDRDFSANYDFVYQNGTWSPAIPTALNTNLTDLFYVYNGKVTLSEDLKMDDFTVSPWADVDLEGTFDMDNKLIVEPGGVFTFKSNASNTGQIKAVEVDGEVTVERYIPGGRRAFRFLTAPVTTGGTINDNWQEGVNNTGNNYPADNNNPVLNFGTHISGDTGGNNGFDATTTGNPSMFTFDNTATGSQDLAWQTLPDTNLENLEQGKPYLALIRGSRIVDLSSNTSPSDETTLRAKGTMNLIDATYNTSSNVNVISDVDGYFSFIANPYQATVNLQLVNFTNVNSQNYWYWDPNLNNTSAGGYVNVNIPLGTNNVSSSANEFLMPGQSIFVETDNGGTLPPEVTFSQDDIDLTAIQTSVFNENDSAMIKVLLYRTQLLNQGERESDGLVIRFSQDETNAVTASDGVKFFNSGENIARVQNGDLLSFENRAMPTDDETLELLINNFDQANQYSFVVNLDNITSQFEAVLVDHYTETTTLLEAGSNQIDFTVDSNIPESKASNRFSISINNSTLSINANDFGSNFRMFPNPTSDGRFSISTPGITEDIDVEISNILGQTLMRDQLPVNGYQVEVNAQKLTKGIYLVKLTQDNKTFTAKLMVE